MIKITDALKAIISENSELSFGLHHGLFNLTQLARFLKPHVSARTKKEISEAALLMAISRLQRKRGSAPKKDSEPYLVERVSLHTGLYLATYVKSSDNHAAVASLYKRAQRDGGYMVISEGISEITIVIEQQHLAEIRQLLTQKPIVERKGAVSLGIRFNKKYLNVPGFIQRILQSLSLQNINVLEISSTATELAVYLDDRDRHLALDTILASFKQQ